MKRRLFIVSAIAATTVIAVPFLNFRGRNTRSNDPLTCPDVLSRFCDEKTIREIGIDYRRRFPEENKKEKLIELLLTNDAGQKLALHSTPHSVISDLIEQKVQKDFKTESLVVINGWVLSATESRQCALLSLS